MNKGTVKWFSAEKGWGFITNEDGIDVFVRYTAIEGEGFKTLEAGQTVIYDFKETEKGLQATKVIKC